MRFPWILPDSGSIYTDFEPAFRQTWMRQQSIQKHVETTSRLYHQLEQQPWQADAPERAFPEQVKPAQDIGVVEEIKVEEAIYMITIQWLWTFYACVSTEKTEY